MKFAFSEKQKSTKNLFFLKIFIFLAVIIIFASNIQSLSISPGRTTLDFEPGMEKQIKLRIINNEDSSKEYLISGKGDLNEYISVSEKSLNLEAGESKEITYSVNLPEELPPGLNEGGVVVVEIPGDESIEEVDKSNSYVKAAMAVVSQLHVNVPYPGRYAEAELKIDSKSDKATFYIPVESKGEFDLIDVKAYIEILDSSGNEVDSFTTSSVDVPSSERREITSEWGKDAQPGEYTAEIDVVYGDDDGEVINLNKSFKIGEKSLELKDLTVEDFSLGDIAKMEMVVENKWNSEVKDAHIDAEVYQDGDKLSTFKSASQNIPASSKKVLTAYWDTKGINTGIYDADFSLEHKEESIEENIKLEVKEDEINAIGLGYVISEQEESDDKTLVIVLVVLVIVLMIVNIWFLFLRKKLLGKK